jgi:hypothetical protein
MAINEAVNIGISVDGTASVEKAANSYEDLGDAVAKTQREAERLATTFGINDKRTQDAIKVAGRYKQQMEELDLAIDGARGGVDTLFRATQGVVAGFNLAAGAASLFGTESEDLQRILLKVQGAMAFSQGLKDLKEFAPAMLNAARATREWFLSLTLVQKAFVTLGIGLVVDVLFQLYTTFTDVKEITAEAAKAQADYNEKIADLNNELEKLNETETETILRNLEEAQKKRRELLDEDAYLYEQTRFQETEAEKKALKERQDANYLARLELELEEGRLQKRLREIREAEAKKVTEEQKKQTEELKKSQELQAKVKADTEQTNAEMNEFIAKQNEITARGIENVTKTNEISLEQNDVVLKSIEQRQLSALEQAQLFIGAYGAELKDTFEQSLRAIDALSQAFAGDDEARQKKAFELSKKLSIVQTTIATIESTVQAFKEAQKNPLNQVTAGAYAISQAAIAAAFGLAQIQQIRNQSFSGGTKPSVQGGGGGQAVPRFQAPSTRIPGGGDEFTQVRRVYVTERDITNVQEKVKVTESLSQF